MVFSLSVGHVFLALLVASITTVAVRNVGALLDIVLLKRLEMRADATYAIKVVTRYALTAIGVAAASRVLDIGWNNLQWLVAALSVGLGFGLQEIFANFVSGLIVLAERPIRIGDVVTVGDVTGTVARIRARATAVIDFDNKEVIIPNKAFITDRVINWTLSTGTTRLLIKVGVAYGCDTALVQKLLLEIVQANDDVLEQPSPSVYFIDFGSVICIFVRLKGWLACPSVPQQRRKPSQVKLLRIAPKRAFDRMRLATACDAGMHAFTFACGFSVGQQR
ncbi:MAG: mechanosensitive ion channel [Propionivibrio sp.]|nr:mechanosensitive ion channel [Propionivibrio sp.]